MPLSTMMTWRFTLFWAKFPLSWKYCMRQAEHTRTDYIFFSMCTFRTVLTLFLFVARAFISGAFQAAYVYTPEVCNPQTGLLYIYTVNSIHLRTSWKPYGRHNKRVSLCWTSRQPMFTQGVPNRGVQFCSHQLACGYHFLWRTSMLSFMVALLATWFLQ